MKAEEVNKLTERLIGAAIEVHRVLGPGLLESAYHECYCRQLSLDAIGFEREVPLTVEYKGVRLACGYRLDLLAEKLVVIEIKAVEAILPVHEAQLLTYLRLGNYPVGLLINFNVNLLKNGVRRKVNGLIE
jgi:GxxExxY protein